MDSDIAFHNIQGPPDVLVLFPCYCLVLQEIMARSNCPAPVVWVPPLLTAMTLLWVD
jgi:hypothetical protein